MEIGLDLLNSVVDVALDAGIAILEIYHRDFEVLEKDDRSPLTEADLASNRIILEGLTALSDLPVISEESAEIPFAERSAWNRFWMVDPLDGTKEFIKKNGEFTVNIALVEDGIPVLGVVHAPAMGVTYKAASRKAWKRTDGEWGQIDAALDGSEFKVVASRSHAGPETEAFLANLQEQHPNMSLASIGSSLKLCLVAEGFAQLYPRFGPTMEWDVAAAHAVVNGAGGKVVDFLGIPLQYNKPDLHNPYFIVGGRHFEIDLALLKSN